MAGSLPPSALPLSPIADTPFLADIIFHLDYCNHLLSAVSTSRLFLPATSPGYSLGFSPKSSVLLTSLFCSKLLTKSNSNTQLGIGSPPGDASNPVSKSQPPSLPSFSCRVSCFSLLHCFHPTCFFRWCFCSYRQGELTVRPLEARLRTWDLIYNWKPRKDLKQV